MSLVLDQRANHDDASKEGDLNSTSVWRDFLNDSLGSLQMDLVQSLGIITPSLARHASPAPICAVRLRKELICDSRGLSIAICLHAGAVCCGDAI